MKENEKKVVVWEEDYIFILMWGKERRQHDVIGIFMMPPKYHLPRASTFQGLSISYCRPTAVKNLVVSSGRLFSCLHITHGAE